MPDTLAAIPERATAATRISRKESQARTRDRLIEVAREHFLRDGLGGAKVESIAEEAGYTRGAFYANFADKNELFVAVAEATADAEMVNLRSTLQRVTPDHLEPLRDVFRSLISNGKWVQLQTEFLNNALRNESIRREFQGMLENKMKEASCLLNESMQVACEPLGMSSGEMMLVFSSLLHGMALRQLIARPLSDDRAAELMVMVFARLLRGSETGSANAAG